MKQKKSSFVKTPRKFMIAICMRNNKFTWCFHKAELEVYSPRRRTENLKVRGDMRFIISGERIRNSLRQRAPPFSRSVQLYFKIL